MINIIISIFFSIFFNIIIENYVLNFCIAGGYVDLTSTISIQSKENLSSDISNTSLESDAVFFKIAEYVKANSDEVKKINGIFLYHILVKGKLQAQWSKYTFSFLNLC